MEPFKFSPIDFSKVGNEHVMLVYHPTNALLADIEVMVERPEANKLGIPKNYAISTHVGKILKIDDPLDIPLQKGMLWWKKQVIQTLQPNTYIFEEGVGGVEVSVFKDKYASSTCIEIRKRIVPFNDLGIATMKDSVIKNYQRSFAYGWPAFITQPFHTILGVDLVKKTILGMEICSALVATIVNDACRAVKVALDFTDEYNTNPLEWQVNSNWVRDTNVQPLN
jgi:hypothetical protein